MAWTFLIVAGLFEICWAIGLKYTDGFSKFWPTAGTLMAMAASFGFLAQALKSIPVGTGYAVWTGIGAAGTAVLGIVLFAESVSIVKVFSLLCIVLGIIGLKGSA
ncbi:MAG: quaternary ammonium compound efflux SMR transporter SugE [Nitrospira sp.]|nr:quaternary ammonium compound efflux SMR transporter SugE [Nitrospira sp.]MBX3340596.1 quaternary ammonium compound efflux SMR transporter SugE [Nitrospira sp.]MBX3371710.1 quaternary ammonium compound efflux SMR transporter SugE [Nitrospira sp.]MBX7040998.1 quaternary ammonium compound efflux SMR transporter SugE [Nitrospira sp.]MCW5796639.1 quaternary ammonium compound efflux SMR transporter SugE [Nitrospira sp.]